MWSTHVKCLSMLILKQLTGEHLSYVNDGTSLDELNDSLKHDRSAPDLEPLPLPMCTTPEGFINEVNVTKAFLSLQLKSSSGHDGLSKIVIKYAPRELSAAFPDLFYCPF